MKLVKDGKDIESLEDWLKHAPPQRKERHWKDGRSAKEFARAFVEAGSPQIPPEINNLLNSSARLGKVKIDEGWPEHKIKLDSYRGNTRNADMAAIGVSGIGQLWEKTG